METSGTILAVLAIILAVTFVIGVSGLIYLGMFKVGKKILRW